jgi:hypothetical protein
MGIESIIVIVTDFDCGKTRKVGWALLTNQSYAKQLFQSTARTSDRVSV